MVARPVLDVPPMNIGCDGVFVNGSSWERYNFAHPGASVSVSSGSGQQLNLLQVCIVRRDWRWLST
jgi:hypothetical protein